MRIKVLLLSILAASFSTGFAQENYELGKPGDSNYDYLKDYRPLKEYIDYSKYPNFKLGIGTTVNEYLQKGTVYGLTNDNFTETVAGNAMKMSSCVDNNGNMNFTTVKNYVAAATEAGINIYGHTLAWHSQQANGYLRSLIKDRKEEGGQEEETVVASKDFTKDKSVGWASDKDSFGYSITFGTDGMKITTTKECTNFWDVQFQAMTDIPLETGKTYKMTVTIKGSSSGKMHYKLGDFSDGEYNEFPFTDDWTDAEIDCTPKMDNNFLLLQCGDFVGDIYVKSIKFSGMAGKTTPLTDQEKKDTLIYAMDRWIQGMMEACDGKVKAWDVVNEAIAGDGDDGEGNYVLQHTNGYYSGTWDVGGDAFYWQDFLGDLDYVRQAVRLARKYGPEDVKLFINDYNLESTWDDNKKVKSLINWIKKWEADGVTKIDGIGTQMHITYYTNSSDQDKQKKAITKMFELMAESGKLVRVSEMDMGIAEKQQYPSNAYKTENVTADQEKKMAEYYEWIIKEYLRIIPAEQQWGICQWCPTDAPSNSGWRAGEPVGIWTLDYYRKHVYAGFANGLGGVPTGLESIINKYETPKDIYNLYGKKVGTDLESLPSGVYIMNGKKVMK